MGVDRRRAEASCRAINGRGWRAALPAIVAVMAVVGLVLLPLPAPPVRAAGTSLHEVDWPAVLARDPTITVVPPTSSARQDPGLHIRVPLPDGHDLDGYVLV